MVLTIVWTETIETTLLTADGQTLKVSVSYNDAAQIPDDATLEVKEILNDDPEWNERSVRFADVVNDKYGNVTISDLRFLKISIMVDGKEVEPKAPVEVKVEYTDELNTEDTAEYYVDEEAGELRPDPEDQVSHFVAVHYGEEGAQILDAKEIVSDGNIVETTIITPGFSDYDLAYVYEYDAADHVANDTIPYLEGGTLTSEKVALLNDTADDSHADSDTKAADGATVPYISKTLGDNGDGTYTLGLSVTGSAESTSSASPVNVIIVYDVSNSMINNRAPMTYGSYGLDASSGGSGGSAGIYFQLYKYVNGSYSEVSDSENYTGTVYRRTGGVWQYTYTAYTGQRFSSNIMRADAAEKTLYDFTTALFGYQDQTDPTNIQAALITFSGSATTTQSWTSTASAITNRVSSTGAANSRKLTYSTGTNWEGALAAAYNLINDSSTDEDPTYVVFITDGAPSRTGSGTGTNVTSQYSDSNNYYEAAMNESRLVYNATTATGGSFYGIYAFGTETDWLASLMYYAYNGSETTYANNGESFETDGYYNASSTEELNAAISDIFSKIVDTMGVGQASITDGTTSSVTTTTGEITDLLDVDDTSFQYWLSWQVTTGDNGTYTFTMPDKYNKNNGEDITYTVSVSGGTVTLSWTEKGTAKTASYSGTVQNNVLTIEWTAATDFYNYTPPTAVYNDSTGAVDWNLAGLGTLLDSVTYRVTFEVYPSQTTLDLIADLKNGYVEYDDLDANIKKYLSEDYTLATNTNATLTYTDTRNEDGEQTKDYTNPDPVGVSAAKELTVSKKWNNTLDNRDNWISETITLWVTRDGTERYPITMNAGNEWTGEAYISYGLLTVDTDGTVHMKTTGHDYSFAESIDVSYNWEIEVPTIRPMIINKNETMLVKVEASDVPESLVSAEGNAKNGDYYKLLKNGSTEYEYYKVDSALASLTAVNHRRSYLDVTKTVTGNGGNPGDEFEFTMTVTTNATGADPENYNSDAWVWFDIWDSDAGAIVIDADAVSATGLMYEDSNEGVDISERVHSTIPENFNGYYCVPTGTQITVKMQNGYSLRFLNLPVGATYTVVESETMPSEVYAFKSIEGTRSFDEDQDENTEDDWTTESAGTVTGQSISGTIEYVESAYKVAVTNELKYFFVYHTSDNTIERIAINDERVTDNGFNIVTETKTGYLYGGYYSAYTKAGMTDAQIFAATYSENGTSSSGVYADAKTTGYWTTDSAGTAYTGSAVSFKNANAYTVSGKTMTPVAGTVYYLKEVPNQYFRPATYVIWDTRSENLDLKKLYMLSVTDDSLYQMTGLDGTIGLDPVTRLYTTFKVTNDTGDTKTIKATVVNSSLPRGYLTVWDANSKIAAGSYTMTPYFITKDGVKVTSTVERTVTIGTKLSYSDFTTSDRTIASTYAVAPTE